MEQYYNYLNTKWEQGYKDSYTIHEINEFDKKIKILWQEMIRALSEDEIEKAVSYFHDQSRDSYRKRFTAFSSEVRRKIANELSMSTIKLEEIKGDTAIYIFVTERDGKKYLRQITFLRLDFHFSRLKITRTVVKSIC